MILVIAASVGVLLTGCDPISYFSKKKASTEPGILQVATEEVDGVATGRFAAQSPETQRMAAPAGSGIAGAYIDLPPGSLAIDTNISIEEGGDLTSLETLDELGLGNSDTESGGATVLVTPDTNVDPAKPYSLAVNISENELELQRSDARRIAILYKAIVFRENQKVLVGVIPPDQITRKGNQLVFSTPYWGAYQAIYTTADLTVVKQTESKSGIIAKRDLPQIGSGEMGFQFQKVAPAHSFNWYVEALDQNGNVIKTSETWRFETK